MAGESFPNLSPQQVLVNALLCSQAFASATDRLLHYIDERYLKSGCAPLFQPRPPVLVGADDGTIRALRCAGLCDQQLTAIARSTWCTELKDLMNNLRYLPVVSITDTSG